MDEGENARLTVGDVSAEKQPVKEANRSPLWVPFQWFSKLAEEIHWTVVLGVIIVYGTSQGIGGALNRVATDYYWKDVQKVQPSEAQIYQGITSIPWIVKPLWGLLTDVLPVAGYQRRPYLAVAGLLGMISMLTVSLHKTLHVFFALLALTASSAGAAIADVTIDACVAQNSINHPSLAADMQSLCGLSSSIGGLIGYFVSGFLVHLIGPQELYLIQTRFHAPPVAPAFVKRVLGLLSVPAALTFLVGTILKESNVPDFAYGQVYQKFLDANRMMWTTLKCPDVWRPCLYMYMSLALSLNIHEGMFYWYTDSKAGPALSQETVGFIYSIGSVGSLLGVLLYQNILKDHPFRSLLLWTQTLLALSGMLDLVLVTRLNLKIGVPDYFFIVIDESVFKMISRLKWMPLLVLSTKLCPPGIEGTFFALLMSIDNVGLLTSSWGGGQLLHVLNVTREEFGNLWEAILIRNIMRLLPLVLLPLVPNGDPNSSILPAELLVTDEAVAEAHEGDDVEMVSLVENRH